MTERYEPPSDFLKMLRHDQASLSGSEHGNSNLHHLISLMSDTNPANRDWATFFLSQADLDTSEVGEALLSAANDGKNFARAEAILGLAQ